MRRFTALGLVVSVAGWMAVALAAAVVALAAAPADAAEAKALLWRIEHPGFQPGYLFGTMHVDEPDIIDISPAVRAALLEADMLVGEGVPSAAFEAAIIADVARTQPHERAEALLDAQVMDGLVEAGRCYGIEEEEARVLPLWVLVAVFALLSPEDVRQERQYLFRRGERILDEELAHIALTAGKFALWIESPRRSIGFFKDMPRPDVLALLDEVARDPTCEPEQGRDVVLDLYRARDLDGMLALIDHGISQVEDPALWRRLWRRLLPERNHGMVQRIESLAQVNKLFVAVGAAHLPGEEGVIALLRQRGWQVEPIE
jgi:uncharacterized protein YbaP (TraB family)